MTCSSVTRCKSLGYFRRMPVRARDVVGPRRTDDLGGEKVDLGSPARTGCTAHRDDGDSWLDQARRYGGSNASSAAVG